MEISLTIRVDAASTLVAKALSEALEPDNVQLPERVQLAVRVRGEILEISLRSSDIGSLLNTMNDILSCLQPALKLSLKHS
ncbi:MAG: hypothetical protein DRJ62_00410 [Thermoprotei archaeon]|nr:MAG: hypothetical protein DRJ62_00410 [Thermoprotei archaeon]